ncbi:MAG: hypothetical protein WA432_05045 [Candidatus Babeliaceae bacterium]
MTIQTTTQATLQQVPDELILVVKRDDFFPFGAWQGLEEVNHSFFIDIIQQKKAFLPRSQMEQDSSYKQIIPYLIFTHENRYFLMQRTSTATEQRLHSKYTLGIGGHIRQEDMIENDKNNDYQSILNWARREFEEEINYSGSYKIEPLGILNDDSNTVGQVHVGFVFLLHGDSADISVKSELKSGQLLTLDECSPIYDSMETWTKIVFDFLNKSSNKSCCC